MLAPLPNITGLQALASKAEGRRDKVIRDLAEVRQKIKALEEEEELLVLVAGLFRTLIDQEVTEGVRAVEQLQTEGLKAVFSDQEMSVRADIDVQRGKVSVDLVTVYKEPGGEVIEGLAKDDFGGSVLTVQSVLLRVIVMMRRGLRPLLLLDESLSACDPNYISNLGTFLSLLCRRLGMDILMVTHQPALVEASDHAYRIVRVGGEATFEKVR